MVGEALVRRRSRETSEAQRDREVLLWIARFRFVTAEVLAERFGVSHQRMNVRLRRLEQAGLVTTHRSEPTQARAVFLTGIGARRLGVRIRRAPRPDAHRVHELAVVSLATRLELDPAAPAVLSERECRGLEADKRGRFSADLRERDGTLGRRWPDLVLRHADGTLVAVEIEFSSKAPERLRRIVAGLAQAHWFGDVHFLVREAPLAQRITALADAERPSESLTQLLGFRGPRLRVDRWAGAATAAQVLAARTPAV